MLTVFNSSWEMYISHNVFVKKCISSLMFSVALWSGFAFIMNLEEYFAHLAGVYMFKVNKETLEQGVKYVQS